MDTGCSQHATLLHLIIVENALANLSVFLLVLFTSQTFIPWQPPTLGAPALTQSVLNNKDRKLSCVIIDADDYPIQERVCMHMQILRCVA